MNNRIFGEVKFNFGFETSCFLDYEGKSQQITVVADAYFENDGITEAQEDAYSEFIDKQEGILRQVMSKINTLDGKYVPTMLLIKRDGNYGLVFDDCNDSENGIVVTIKPTFGIMSTDQYF